MKKGPKRRIWIAAVSILVIIAAVAAIFCLQDSERTNEQEKRLNISAYPVSIPQEYPELLKLNDTVNTEYLSFLDSFAQKFDDFEYGCYSPPQLSKVNFTYLKPKYRIYSIRSSCSVPGETSPYTDMPELRFYATDGGLEMFYTKNMGSRFSEIFSNLSDEKEVSEYLDSISFKKLYPTLQSALDNSLLRLSIEDFRKECDVFFDPSINSTLTKKDGEFIYDGLTIDEEVHARGYLEKYSISFDGNITQISESMFTFCETGIIY